MTTQLSTKPEHMLPVMIVLAVMFVGICIALNLFSRARFKKRRNVFVATARTAAQQKRAAGGKQPGSGHRLNSACASPSPHWGQQQQQSPTKQNIRAQSIVDESGRTSVLSV